MGGAFAGGTGGAFSGAEGGMTNVSVVEGGVCGNDSGNTGGLDWPEGLSAIIIPP